MRELRLREFLILVKNWDENSDEEDDIDNDSDFKYSEKRRKKVDIMGAVAMVED